MSETGAAATTAPTEIENLIWLSANDISAFPKWPAAAFGQEHGKDTITLGVRGSLFSCKTRSLVIAFDGLDPHPGR